LCISILECTEEFKKIGNYIKIPSKRMIERGHTNKEFLNYI
jgi:hypothetical protein